MGSRGGEAEVAFLLAERRTNAEIAEALFISPHTARYHTEAVMGKLGVGRRRAVAALIQEESTAGDPEWVHRPAERPQAHAKGS